VPGGIRCFQISNSGSAKMEIGQNLHARDALTYPLGAAARRAAIEAELRKDPDRSDREIARVVGCDHKTVRAARERPGIASPLGNSPPNPTKHRRMLIEGCKDFDTQYPPVPSDVHSAEEAVDNAIAKGVVSATVQAAVDQAHGAMARMRVERHAEAAKEDETNGEQTMIRPQREVTIQFDDSTGEWVIKQKNWPDDDGAIYINEEHMPAFRDALCDRLGIGSIRGAG
jgi:hypothetical protein